MTQPALALSPEQLQPLNEKIKYRYFRSKAISKSGHNDYIGTHGNDPKSCMACVSTIVASTEFDGKTYFGVAFRNDKDQVNRNIGKLIARNRLMKNIGESCAIKQDAFRDAVRGTYESEPYFDIKYYWKALVASIGCY